ncbi:M56 family metallopeptidase [Paraglaciecola aquimarina]|uniref:M56 family metallopeptidase n=1 Tax=Paraglaciecola algarum TaxID=3050085 RepID=A0ABS9D9J4_9ALTE|nr:M56 family metallopeptidase [Paraglaciecola sp. G1-23]MCF2948326.1 M56 family metallopeptidase [Paraglaciecola sp. G1-23]
MDRFTFIFDNQIIYALGWTIIHSFWQSLFVLGLLSFSLMLNKRSRPETRYWLSIFAMICCAIISVKTFLICYRDIIQTSAIFNTLNLSGNTDVTQSFWTVTFQTLNPWLNNIVLIWYLGFAIQGVRFVMDLLAIQDLKRNSTHNLSQSWTIRLNELKSKLGICKHISFVQSAKIQTPCVIGHINPIVLLPLGLICQLPDEQIEAIVLHELAHIKRHDYLVNIFQSLLKVLFFFNPFVLAISKRVDIERENACDDIAVKACKSSFVYANGLSQIAAESLKNQAIMAASKSEYLLLARVKRLFSHSQKLNVSMEKFISLCCAVLLALSLNVSATNNLNTFENKPENEVVLVESKTPVKNIPTIANNNTDSKKTTLIEKPIKQAMPKTLNIKQVTKPEKQQAPLDTNIVKVSNEKTVTSSKVEEEKITNSVSAAANYIEDKISHQTQGSKSKEKTINTGSSIQKVETSSAQLASFSPTQPKVSATLANLNPTPETDNCGRFISNSYVPSGDYAITIQEHNGKRIRFANIGGFPSLGGFISLNLKPGLHSFRGFAVCTQSYCKKSNFIGGGQADEVNFTVNVQANKSYRIAAKPKVPRSLKRNKRFEAFVVSAKEQQCDDIIARPPLETPKPQLSKLSDKLFAKLLSVPMVELQDFGYIVYAPIKMDDIEISSRFKTWKTLTSDYLPELGQQSHFVERIADNKQLNNDEYQDIIDSTLVAQIRLKRIKHNKLEKCQSNPHLSTIAHSYSFCQYTHNVKGVVEVVVMHPKSKELLMYGETLIEVQSDFSKNKGIKAEQWKNKHEKQFWANFIEKTKSQITKTLRNIQQQKYQSEILEIASR